MRMTTNAIPGSAALAAKWHLPLGCVIRPLAPPAPDAQPVQLLESPHLLVRCTDCRAYINPFVSFVDGGRRWICNMCNRYNEGTDNCVCESPFVFRFVFVSYLYAHVYLYACVCVSVVPQTYYQHANMQAIAAGDLSAQPELANGSIEFLATKARTLFVCFVFVLLPRTYYCLFIDARRIICSVRRSPRISLD